MSDQESPKKKKRAKVANEEQKEEEDAAKTMSETITKKKGKKDKNDGEEVRAKKKAGKKTKRATEQERDELDASKASKKRKNKKQKGKEATSGRKAKKKEETRREKRQAAPTDEVDEQSVDAQYALQVEQQLRDEELAQQFANEEAARQFAFAEEQELQAQQQASQNVAAEEPDNEVGPDTVGEDQQLVDEPDIEMGEEMVEVEAEVVSNPPSTAQILPLASAVAIPSLDNHILTEGSPQEAPLESDIPTAMATIPSSLSNNELADTSDLEAVRAEIELRRSSRPVPTNQNRQPATVRNQRSQSTEWCSFSKVFAPLMYIMILAGLFYFLTFASQSNNESERTPAPRPAPTPAHRYVYHVKGYPEGSLLQGAGNAFHHASGLTDCRWQCSGFDAFFLDVADDGTSRTNCICLGKATCVVGRWTSTSGGTVYSKVPLTC